MVLPAAAAAEIDAAAAAGVAPVGLRDYLTPYEAPAAMPHLRAFLSGPKRATDGDGGGWVNPGLTLRWHAALGTMEDYNALPRDVALRATQAFVSDVRARVAAAGPYLCVVGDEGGAHVDYFVGGSSGIVSVAVYVATDPSLPPPPSASRYARCLLPASSAVDTPSHPRHSFSPPLIVVAAARCGR